jgi:hypothetical protein
VSNEAHWSFVTCVAKGKIIKKISRSVAPKEFKFTLKFPVQIQKGVSYNAIKDRVGAIIRKVTFVARYIGEISLYDSGEQCGPWASCF